MGFHKRCIGKEMIIAHYENYGPEGVCRLFKADAVILSGEIDRSIIELVDTKDLVQISLFLENLRSYKKSD